MDVWDVMRGEGGSAADGVSVECSVGVLAIYWGSRRERERERERGRGIDA
jgi:hypothetical protein